MNLINLYKINAYALFCGMRFSLAIIFVDFEQRGLSFSQIGILFAVQAMASLIMEIPSGTITDKIGSKYSLAISSSAIGVAYYFMAVESSFPNLCLVFTLWGLGKAFHSGADTSFIIESLKASKNEHHIPKFLGQKWSMFYLGLAVSAISCTLISSSFGVIWTYYATCISAAIATLIILCAKNPKIDHSSSNSIKHVTNVSEYLTYLSFGIKFLLEKPMAKTLVAISIIFTVSAQIFFQYIQNFMLEIGILKLHFGNYYALFTIISAFCSRQNHKLEKRFSLNKVLIALCFLNIFSLGQLSLSYGLFISMLGIIGMQIQTGLSTSIMNHYINLEIDSYHRATINSIKSFGHGTTMMVISPLIGFIADTINIQFAVTTLSSFTLIISVVYLRKIILFNN
jgi:hypothetical protein